MIKDQPAGSGSKRRLSIPVMAAFGAGELVQAVVTIGCTAVAVLLSTSCWSVGHADRAGARHRPVFRRCNRSRSRQPVGSNPGRYGRRHPVMAGAAIPLAIAFFFLFYPQTGWLSSVTSSG